MKDANIKCYDFVNENGGGASKLYWATQPGFLQTGPLQCIIKQVVSV
jgi:hypothetical protein